MHPTMTEHDYRFPRRPDYHQRPTNHARMDDDLEMNGRGGGGGGQANRPGSSQVAAIRQSLAASSDLFGGGLFPTLPGPEQSSSSNVQQLQDQDPLAAQVWKFFTKTKQQLPNQQRMENLTWRMMALSMRKRSQDEQK